MSTGSNENRSGGAGTTDPRLPGLSSPSFVKCIIYRFFSSSLRCGLYVAQFLIRTILLSGSQLGSMIEIRQCKYLNNVVEQDHRRVKQKTRAALGFKAFYSAHVTLQGVELIQMIRKGQVRPILGGSDIEQFNLLAM